MAWHHDPFYRGNAAATGLEAGSTSAKLADATIFRPALRLVK